MASSCKITTQPSPRCESRRERLSLIYLGRWRLEWKGEDISTTCALFLWLTYPDNPPYLSTPGKKHHSHSQKTFLEKLRPTPKLNFGDQNCKSALWRLSTPERTKDRKAGSVQLLDFQTRLENEAGTCYHLHEGQD